MCLCVWQLQAAYPESDMIRDGALALIAFVVANHRRCGMMFRAVHCDIQGRELCLYTTREHGLK